MFNIPVFSIIFFNHESNLRSKEFVFKKISDYLKKSNYKKKLIIGNINVKRDWGWSPEYMAIVFKIMKSRYIDDYILATGLTTDLKSIIKLFFKKYNLNYKKYIKVSKKFYRSNEIKKNYANISKLKNTFKIYPKVNYKKITNYF